LGEITTIPLTKSTRDRLRELGAKGETYDALLNRLVDFYEKFNPRPLREVAAFEMVQGD
jgi:hypothetical protein